MRLIKKKFYSSRNIQREGMVYVPVKPVNGQNNERQAAEVILVVPPGLLRVRALIAKYSQDGIICYNS